MTQASIPTSDLTHHDNPSTTALLENISIRRASWRKRLTIAFALMSVIPLLTFTYFVTAHIRPEVETIGNLPLVMALNVMVVLAGYSLLWKTGRDLSHLSDCVKRVAEGTLSWAQAANRAGEITEINDAIEALVETLQQNRRKLADTSSRLEAEVQSRAQEVAQANQALRQTNMELSRALEEIRTTQNHLIAQERLNALSQMASGIAHDFNNTLMPIVGLSHFLLSHPEIMDDRAELIDTLQDIRSAGDDAKKVVTRLREFYRSDTSSAPSRLDIHDIIESAIQATQPKWQEEMRSNNAPITIERRYTSLPLVNGNAALIKEVFVNLILNAVDASPKGGPIIISTRAQDGSIAIDVADKGRGMSAEAARRCIEPFYTTKNDQGAGLGLSMSYGAIRRHGGTLTVDSELGKGTTIHVQFPVTADSLTTTKDPLPPPPERLKVLVVDDDQRTRKLMSRILAAGQHTATFASDGNEGLTLFAANAFDVVITDRAMPDMSGDAFARAIRKQVSTIPIVMVTGFGDLMRTREQLPDCVDALVAKPVTEVELSTAISAAISRHTPTTGMTTA